MSTLKVLGAGPVKRGVSLLAERFEQSTGHRVSVEFAGAPAVRERVLGGEAADVAVVPQATLDEFIGQGKADGATRVIVGRSRMGIAVRAGAPVPAMASVEAFKQAVTQSDEIVCNVASSGVYMVNLLERLGLAAVTGGKVVKLPNAVKVMEHVAASPARALGVGQLAEISELVERGVAVVLAAPLPDPIQNVTAYGAAVTAASASRDAAAAFTAFLASTEAKSVLSSTGID